MDQPEIETIELQLVDRAFKGRFRALVARVLDPELGRDEQFAAVDPVSFDRSADGLFIAIGGRSVEKPIGAERRRLLDQRIVSRGMV